MKVAMITGSYPPHPCGIGDYSARLADELTKIGIEIEVITTRSHDRKENARVYYELDNWKLGNIRSAAGRLNERSYDLVHIQYPARFYGYRPDLAFLASIIKKKIPRRIPIVATVHEFAIVHWLRKLTIVAMSLSVDAMTITAESEKKMYERVMPWLKRKLHVIHMAPTIPTVPVQWEEREVIRKQAGASGNDVLVGYFGFLHPNKGIEQLFRAFALAREQYRDMKFMVMALFDPARTPYHAAIRSLAERLGLMESIHWTGFLDAEDLSRHLGSLDVAVLPYREGVSLRRLSFISTLGHGIPTVTTRRDVEPSDIGLVDGENVMIAQSKDPNHIAEKVILLGRSPAMRQKLSVNGMAWAEAFRWDNIVEQHRSLYTNLLSQRT